MRSNQNSVTVCIVYDEFETGFVFTIEPKDGRRTHLSKEDIATFRSMQGHDLSAIAHVIAAD